MGNDATIRSRLADHWRKPAIVAISLGLHCVVLGYLGFSKIGDPRRYSEPSPAGDGADPKPVVFLNLAPRSAQRIAEKRDREMKPPPARASPSANVEEVLRPLAIEPPAALPQPRSPAAAGRVAALPSPQQMGAAPWDVRPSTEGDRIIRGLRIGVLGCTSLPTLTRQEQAICDSRFAERASSGRFLGPPPNSDRDEGFARQVRANEAWRDYTRGEGAYPGLRSLFSER